MTLHREHPTVLMVVRRRWTTPTEVKRFRQLIGPLQARSIHVDSVQLEWGLLDRLQERARKGDQTAMAVVRWLNRLRVTRIARPVRRSALRRRLRRLARSGGAALVNGHCLNAELHSMLTRQDVRWIYDVDDALWTGDVALFTNVCRSAWSVTAGSAAVAERTSLLGVTATRLHSGAPTGEPRAHDVASVGELAIGWLGSPSTARYLALVSRPLATLATRRPLTFHIVGATGIGLPDFGDTTVVRHDDVPYDPAKLVGLFDIGIMPLPDGEWERCKGGAKLIDYMAAGLPVVCSPVGENRFIVDDGVSGFFAATDAEWIDRLERLAVDPPLRRSLGLEGWQRVADQYSLDRAADIVDSLVRGTPAPANPSDH